MPETRQKSLHFNLKEGENVVFHHSHRSKRGRNKIKREATPAFYRFKQKKDELAQGVDKKSLRYLRKKYNI